jgi:hypothetical protein
VPVFVNYKKECTRLAAAGDKVYQLLAHGRWLSPGTPASPTTKTGHHDIAEILLKEVLKHQKSNQSNPSVVANPETHWAQDTWQRTKTNKLKNTTKKTKKLSNMNPQKQWDCPISLMESCSYFYKQVPCYSYSQIW